MKTTPKVKYLRNDYVCIGIYEDYAMCNDITDMINEPTCATRGKRGIKRALEMLETVFNEDFKLSNFEYFMESLNIKTHYWCMVD